MKHTNRMFLIPEELYQHYFSPSFNQNQDGTPLGHIQSKMQNLSAPDNSKMDREERAIRFDQEYKRYSKLQKEQEEKPLNVRLQNLKEIMDNMPQPSSITENKTASAPRIIAKKIKYQKKGKPSKVKKVGSLVQNTDEEEDEVYEDAKTEKDEAGTSEAINIFAERKKKANEYVAKNSTGLGINSHGQIVQTSTGGGLIPIKTSNVSTIIDHLVNNEGNRRQPLPTGYDKFVERMVRHPDLVKILGLKQKRHQSGSGKMMAFKKTYKRVNFPFKFKPTLWKIC